MLSIPIEKEIEKIYNNEEKTIEFLFENGIIYSNPSCFYCNTPNMKRNLSNNKLWRCRNYKCQKKISIFKDSFFSKSNISCNDLLRICYKWLCGENYSTIKKQCGHSAHTVSNSIRFCRELVADDLFETRNMIGGEGIEVEVDESKFGKVKYGHGHRVDGVWVVGGVERTPDRKLFLEVVENRSQETLIDVLKRNIKPGSIVYTDLWKGYLNIETQLGITHLTVNHSINYKDPISGAHTNTIEGSWSGIKCNIAPRNRTKKLIDLHLCEFIWRRQNADMLWIEFIKCLKETKY